MMKRSKAILLSLLFLVMLIPASHAQDLSTQGKEFWLSFISNGFKYHPNIPPSGWVRVQLMVSAKRSCEGTILNPNTGWRHDFTVEANNIFSIDLEEEQVYKENYGLLCQHRHLFLRCLIRAAHPRTGRRSHHTNP